MRIAPLWLITIQQIFFECNTFFEKIVTIQNSIRKIALSPDKSAIEGNIRRSLLLADKSAFNYYKDLSEKGYYNRIISGNINQMIEIDSLRCDFDKYPYSVRTFARQIILRESSVTERSLVTRCRLLDAVRSDNNPQGFIIEGFEVTENKDLQTLKR